MKGELPPLTSLVHGIYRYDKVIGKLFLFSCSLPSVAKGWLHHL